jgi:hypothetical protein
LINKIINFKPLTYAILYLVNVIFFSLVYWCLFNDSFKDVISLSYLQTLYFSIITVTTLGYGDIIPNLNSSWLLITIILQVSSGILLIGLFLNSIAQKLSDIKDETILNEKIEEERVLLSKQMALLKPILDDHLKTLAEIYRVTSSKSSNNFHIYPSELFNVEYYNTVCRLSFFTQTYTFKDGKQIDISWAEYLIEEYDIFVNKIDNFLIKFSTNLPINVIEILTKIQKSIYISFPAAEQSLKNHLTSQGLSKGSSLDIGLTLEHSNSSFKLPENEKTVKNYHELLLSLINIIDELLPNNRIQMFIRLDPRYPGVGSAIGKVELEK